MSTRNELKRDESRRYQASGRKGKIAILQEFCRLTGYNRHYAAYILRNHGRRVAVSGVSGERFILEGSHRLKKRRRSRPRVYGSDVYEALYPLWELLNYPCGKRLKACLPEICRKALEFAELEIAEDVVEKLKRISAATIDRMLQVDRAKGVMKCRAKTKPGTLLKHQIALRTGGEWDEGEVGFTEVDLVSHDGGCTRGEFGYTLNMTEIESGWVELGALPNRAQVWVLDLIKQIRGKLPFDLRGIDSDNGGEFINNHLHTYCLQEGIKFTRSRAYRKNDNCHVEQKNYMAVRSYVGHSRY